MMIHKGSRAKHLMNVVVLCLITSAFVISRLGHLPWLETIWIAAFLLILPASWYMRRMQNRWPILAALSIVLGLTAAVLGNESQDSVHRWLEILCIASAAASALGAIYELTRAWRVFRAPRE